MALPLPLMEQPVLTCWQGQTLSCPPSPPSQSHPPSLPLLKHQLNHQLSHQRCKSLLQVSQVQTSKSQIQTVGAPDEVDLVISAGTHVWPTYVCTVLCTEYAFTQLLNSSPTGPSIILHPDLSAHPTFTPPTHTSPHIYPTHSPLP